MVRGRREARRRKYLSLGIGELAAAAVFVFFFVTVPIRWLDAGEDYFALWSALIPLVVLLMQAGVYWLLARSWVERGSMPVRLAEVYRLFRVADAILLVAGLAGVVAWLPSHHGAAVTVVALWAFGVVEYVNYFHVRLAYPIRRWLAAVGHWRTPQLVRDICSAGR